MEIDSSVIQHESPKGCGGMWQEEEVCAVKVDAYASRESHTCQTQITPLCGALSHFTCCSRVLTQTSIHVCMYYCKLGIHRNINTKQFAMVYCVLRQVHKVNIELCCEKCTDHGANGLIQTGKHAPFQQSPPWELTPRLGGRTYTCHTYQSACITIYISLNHCK